MQAIVFTRYGSPDDLQLTEVAKPQPRENELLVRVRASSVNSWDWEYLSGKPFVNRIMFGLFKPKPGKQRLGADIAGVVEAVGTGVRGFKQGDEVFGDLWDNWGGFAEYACIAETSVELKPDNCTFEQAASVPQAGVLALQGLRKAAELNAGDTVLINGAGGGVGTFAIQLAKLAGTEVTGVDVAHKLEAVAAVGADHVMDFKKQDFTRTGKSWDLIIDCQNYRSIFDNRRALNPQGTYAVIGGSMLRILELWVYQWFMRYRSDERRLCLVADGPNKGLAELAELLAEGKLVPQIDRSFSLAEVPEALGYFGQGLHRGKIVISMPH